jgi:GpU protein
VITFGRAAGMRTFYEITRKRGGRFGYHDIHLLKPRGERGGSKLIEIEMKMVLNGAWCRDPHTHLALFHHYEESAIAAPLIIGGKPMGPGMSLFVLEDMEEVHTHWLRRGMLLRATLDLQFREYMPFAGEFGGVLPGRGGLG